MRLPAGSHGRGAVGVVLAAVLLGLPGPALAGPDTGSFAGRVTDSVSGAGLRGVDVQVLRLETKLVFGSPVTAPVAIADATTGKGGKYRVNGLPPLTAGGYWVCFDGGIGGPLSAYTAQCFRDQPGFDFLPDANGFEEVPPTATALVLNGGVSRAGIDAHLVQH